MRKPNFFIVGAPRCGTTAMYSYLSAHPDITMPLYEKEPHYFARDFQAPRFDRFRDNEEKYLSLFAHGQNCSRIGEASVFYLYSKTAAQEIRDYAPDAKLIVMLRNPVDMIFSWYYLLRTVLGEDYEVFEDALAAESNRKEGRDIPKNLYLMPESLYYRELAHFPNQLQRYVDIFGWEQVHIVLMDDLHADTADVYRKTLEFLEVDPTFQTNLEPVNSKLVSRSPIITRLMRNKTLVKIADYVRPVSLPIYAMLRRWNYVPAPKVSMNPETRKQLLEEFIPDIDALSNLLNRDLSHWYQ